MKSRGEYHPDSVTCPTTGALSHSAKDHQRQRPLSLSQPHEQSLPQLAVKQAPRHSENPIQGKY